MEVREMIRIIHYSWYWTAGGVKHRQKLVSFYMLFFSYIFSHTPLLTSAENPENLMFKK